MIIISQIDLSFFVIIIGIYQTDFLLMMI